jgi:hypothetical protein
MTGHDNDGAVGLPPQLVFCGYISRVTNIDSY